LDSIEKMEGFDSIAQDLRVACYQMMVQDYQSHF